MSVRISSAAVFLTLTLVSQLLAQEAGKKYRFSEGDAVGDVIVVENVESNSFDVTAARSDGETVGPFTNIRRLREKYKETNLAADAQGVTSSRRVYTVARRQITKQAGAEPVSSVLSRQGATVSILRKGGKVTATAVKGGKKVVLPADEIKELTAPFRGGKHRFFPEREIGVGEEWHPDTSFFNASDSGFDKAEATARFVEETTFKGHPCAHITVTLAMSGVSSGANMKAELSGDTYYALDLQRVLQMKLTGPISLRGSVQKGALNAKLEGEGTADFSVNYTYLKVAGKDAAAPATAPAPAPAQ